MISPRIRELADTIQPLFNDQAAGHHGLANMTAQAANRAIGVPGNVRKQIQGMAAHGVTE